MPDSFVKFFTFWSAETWCLLGQIGGCLLGFFLARYVAKTRGGSWLCSFLGCCGAMFAHMSFDRQEAFLLLLFTPVAHLLATTDFGWRPPHKQVRLLEDLYNNC
jgi:hypothetical protein